MKYEVHSFEVPEEHLSGPEVAELIQANVKTVFKTLVLENAKHDHFVFVIPVSETLDMKKAAAMVGENKLQLMPLDTLKTVTGYIRGGCSSVGMKTLF
ncbi:YbaK/EbsC family protein, partial [Staphylococcus aureus]|uniref:YbaK/EbsC family protein n=1 Tax=Staphylococcus aureus TaxID=1280 RepID=UPI002814EB45